MADTCKWNLQRPSGGPGQNLQQEPQVPLGILGSSQECCPVNFPGTRVPLPGPATCLPCPSRDGCPNRSSTASGSPAAERSEKAATLGSGPQEGDPEAAPVRSRSLQRGSTSPSLRPISKPTFTPGVPSGPVSLQPARAGNAECRGFQTPGSNLSAPAPESSPGWRSCRKLALSLSAAAPNRLRGRGWRKAEMDGEGC